MKKLIASALALTLCSAPVAAAGGGGMVGSFQARPAQAAVWAQPLAGLSRLLNNQSLNLAQRISPALTNQAFYHLLQEFDSMPPAVQALHIYTMAPMLAELPRGYLDEMSQQVEQLSAEPKGKSAPTDPGQAVLDIVGEFGTAFDASLPKVKERLAAMSRITGQLQDGDLAEVSSMMTEAGYRERLYGQALSGDFTRVKGELRAKYQKGKQTLQAKAEQTAETLAGKQGDPGALPGLAVAQVAAGPSASALQRAAAPPPASELAAALEGSLLAIGELLVDASLDAALGPQSKPELAALDADAREVLLRWTSALNTLASTITGQRPNAERQLKRLDQTAVQLNTARQPFLENPGVPKLAREFRKASHHYFRALNDVVSAAALGGAETQNKLSIVAVVAAGVQADLHELRQRAVSLGLPANDSLGKRISPPSRPRIEDKELARVKAAIEVLGDAVGRVAAIRLALLAREQTAPQPEAEPTLPAELAPLARTTMGFLEELQGLDQTLLTVISANSGYIPIAQRREIAPAFSRITSANSLDEAQAANARLGQTLTLLADRMEPLSQGGRDALTTILMRITDIQEQLKPLYADSAKAGLIPEAAPASLALSAQPGTPITEADWALLKDIFRSQALATVHLPELNAVSRLIMEGAAQTQTVTLQEAHVIGGLERITLSLITNTARLYLEAFVLGAPPEARGQIHKAIADFKSQIEELAGLEALLTSFDAAFAALRAGFSPVTTLNAQQRQLLPETANAMGLARAELEELREALVTTGLWLMDSPSVQNDARNLAELFQELQRHGFIFLGGPGGPEPQDS